MRKILAGLRGKKRQEPESGRRVKGRAVRREFSSK